MKILSWSPELTLLHINLHFYQKFWVCGIAQSLHIAATIIGILHYSLLIFIVKVTINYMHLNLYHF